MDCDGHVCQFLRGATSGSRRHGKNVLDVMENEQFLKKGPDSLKFGIGDGYLQYYLYNWRCPQIEPQGLGIVLL